MKIPSLTLIANSIKSEDDHLQYSRSAGHPLLAHAIADTFEFPVDAMEEVTVSCGSTESIANVIFGIVNPGDEVIVIEPFYDSYLACLSMAEATPKIVTLHAPDFTLNEAELRAAFSNKTKNHSFTLSVNSETRYPINWISVNRPMIC